MRKTSRALSTLVFLLMVVSLLAQAAPVQAFNASVVITRAKGWVTRAVPYSTSKYVDGYRTDCAGYVSMAWGLADTYGNRKSYLPSTFTQVAYPITKNQLQAGDIMLNTRVHVLLFSSWANSSKTEYWAYEMTPPRARYVKVPYPYWTGSFYTGYKPTDYKPYRSNTFSQVNLAKGKVAFATSYFNLLYPPTKANDGNGLTRWISASSTTLKNQWWVVDLGKLMNINQVVITWTSAYAENYFVDWSTDCNHFLVENRVWVYRYGAGTDVVNFRSTAYARCVGIYMIKRAPLKNYYSIYEVEVH